MGTRAKQPLSGIVYHGALEADRHYASGAWVRSTLGDAVRAAAGETPDTRYLIATEGSVTFAEFDTRTERLAAGLLAAGLKPGDRALFQMGTVPETMAALFGCFKAGILPVCTLPQHRELEIGELARLANARAMFVQADVAPSFDQVGFARTMAASCGLDTVVVARGGRAAVDGCLRLETLCEEGDLDEARRSVGAVALDPEDVAVFQLSGGSTGVPKIIPRFHAEYLGQSLSWAELHAITRDDVCLWPLPLIHNAAMVLIMLPALLRRASVVLQPRFEIGAFLDAVEAHRVTYAGSVGPVAPRLLEAKDLGRRNLRSLRMFFALDRADAIEAHVGVPAVNMFGNTEGLLTSSTANDPAPARHGTVGRPSSPFDEVRVLMPEGVDAVALGEIGELCFRGPFTLRGYYNAPEITAASFTPDGFFRTGDLVREVRVEGRSNYVFCGRLKDNISRGNEKFAAEEVERLVVSHPAVVDAKVVAMPDPILGEKACAFIIHHPGARALAVAELGAFLTREGLAKYKLPERIEAIDAFPVTRVGKVDKKAMREIIASKLREEGTLPGAGPLASETASVETPHAAMA